MVILAQYKQKLKYNAQNYCSKFPSLNLFNKLCVQVRVTVFTCLMCVVLMATAHAQRPFYAPNPWWDRYVPLEQYGGGGIAATSTRPPPTARPPISSLGSFGGLGDRFLIPVDGSFRFYNNVPIQGPDTPCVGCTYTFTSNGFIRQF
jgi:hypothetical protein